MTRIDFYILQSGDAQARSRLACRLAEKAYMLDHHIYLHTSDQQQASEIDTLLWTFRQGSFIPHQLQGQPHETECPVIIGYDHQPEQHDQVLINLDHTVPLFFSRFQRVVEIVSQDETIKQQARQRFKFYKDRGYDLHTHNLSV